MVMKRVLIFIICLALCVATASVTILSDRAKANADVADLEAENSGVGIDNISNSNSVISGPSDGANGEKIYTLTSDVTIASADDAAYKAISAVLELQANEGVYAAPATKTVLDGNGKTITTSIPLFDRIGNCEIKNLTVTGSVVATDADIVVETVVNSASVAVLAAVTYGNVTFENVTVDVDLTYAGTYAAPNMGGFIGTANSVGTPTITFKNCSNNGDITLNNLETAIEKVNDTADAKKNGVAGFIGKASDDNGANGQIGCAIVMSGCENNGDITVTVEGATTAAADVYAGGFLGNNWRGTITITNSVNAGDVIGNTNTRMVRAGGFVAHGKADFADCMNLGDVTANSAVKSTYGHGFATQVQKNTGYFIRCINAGDVTVTVGNGLDGRAAGFINQGDAGLRFEQCINLGNITLDTTKGGQPIGGIMSYSSANPATFTDCFNLGKVVRSFEDTHVGAIVGQSNADGKYTFTNVYTLKIEGSAPKIYDGINEVDSLFTISAAEGTGAAFESSISKIFYETLAKIANGDGENKKDIEFGGIVTLKKYADKIGEFDHETFDAYLEANKAKLADIDSLYMSAVFTDGRATQTLGEGELDGDKYSVNVKLLDATANVTYVAKTFVKVGDLYVYSK